MSENESIERNSAERRGCDGDHCTCECHYLATLPAGGCHDYCHRCSGDPPVAPDAWLGCGYD